MTFEYENEKVKAFLTDKNNSIVDSINRYLLCVLEHSSIVTQPFDKNMVDKI